MDITLEILQSQKAGLQKKPRIIGGVNTEAGRHPYFALSNEKYLCGAVLISKRFVLTAAHCVGADNDFEIGISERLSGWASLYSDTDSGGVEYPWSRVVIHPSYTNTDVDSDIAIYELESDVPDSILYMHLEKDPVMVEGTPMAVIGFGDMNPSQEDVEASDFLLEATVEYMPKTQCINQMKSAWGFLFSITDSMLCGYSDGGDTCQGDSGGPLFLKGETVEDDALVGIVSWGYGCGGSTPGVYARISYFYDWIVETMCFLNEEGVPDYIDCSDVASGGSGASNPNAVTPSSSGMFDDEDNSFVSYLKDAAQGWFTTVTGN